MRDWRRGDLPGIHSHDVLMNWTRVHERVVVNDGHAIGYALIHVRHIVDVVYGDVVVNVRHLGDVHPRVGDVHSLHVSRAGPIPGYKHFTWS